MVVIGGCGPVVVTVLLCSVCSVSGASHLPETWCWCGRAQESLWR